jgi:hypothetical protein
MTELEAFIIRGHEKIIGHYRRLRDNATSALERERFQRCMEEEEDALQRFTGQRWQPLRRAA